MRPDLPHPSPVSSASGAAARGILLIAVSAVCYGISPVLAKVSFGYGLNPGSLLTYRSLTAVLLISVILLIGRTPPRISRADAVRFLYVGLFATGAVFLMNESYLYLDVGLTTALHYTYPMFVNILSALVFRVALTKARLTSLALGLAGVFVLAFNTNQRSQLTGILLAVLSGFVFAVYMILLEHRPFETRHPMVVSFYLNLAILAYTLLYNVTTGQLRVMHSPMALVYLVLLAVLNSIIALMCFRTGVLLLGAAKAAIISTMEPVISVLFGVTLLGEPVTLLLLIGLALIMFGLFIANIHFLRRRT